MLAQQLAVILHTGSCILQWMLAAVTLFVLRGVTLCSQLMSLWTLCSVVVAPEHKELSVGYQ